jgi:eukaryotic-like serine/threonine-protein kinase
LGATQKLLRFGAFGLNLDTEELRKDGTLIRLAPQPFRLLALLASHAGQVVTREEIQKQIWGDDTFVDFEHGMNQCINQIRSVLNDSAERPVYVETIPRHGYRFLAPVVSKTIAVAAAVVESATSIEVQPVVPVSKSVPSGRSEALLTAAPQTVAAPPSRVTAAAAVAVIAVVAVLAGGLYWRSRKFTALTDKDTIVLADFTNRTGDAVFDDALNTALAVEFGQTPFLNVLGPDKVRGTLKLMNQPANARLTPALAREVCQRTNSKAVVAGSIYDAGNHYRIELNALDCQTGMSFAKTEKEAANRNEVVRTLGIAGSDLRSQMGEPRASLQRFNKPLDEATSSSLEALQALTMAANVKRQHGDAATGAAYLKRAVELDPNYAQAYVNLGVPYLNANETGLTAQNFRKAYELRDRVTQRDRFAIESFYYIGVTGELEKGIQTFTEAAKVYPKDPSWSMDLSAVFMATGQYERSAAQAQESIRLVPAAAAYVNLMTSCAAMMGDKAAARKSYQDFLTLWKDADPDIPIYQQAKAEYAKLQ